MGISFADIREADRLDRSYAAAKRRHVGYGDPAGAIAQFVAKWGLPFLPLLPLAWGGEVLRGWWFAVGLVALCLIALRSADAIARRSEFEVLRYPDPAALFVARLARPVAWLVVCGGALAAWRCAALPAEVDPVVRAMVYVASICGSISALAVFVRRARARGSGRSTRSTIGCIVIGVLLLIGFAILSRTTGADFPGFIVAISAMHFAQDRGVAWWESIIDGALVALSLAVVLMEKESGANLPAALTAGACVLAAVRVTHTVVDGIRHSRRVAEKERDPSPAAGTGPTLTALVRRPSPGVGTTRALTRKALVNARWLFEPEPGQGIVRRTAALAIAVVVAMPISVAWRVRSVIGAAAAVWMGASDERAAPILAVAAAAFSPSILDTDLDERLHLFGVDYCEQVRHAKRTWFVVGCVPCVVVAAATLVVTAAAPGAVAAACLLGACLLLRFGWHGFAGETAFVSGGFAAIALIGALLLFEPSNNALLGIAAGIGALGLLGIEQRFRNLDEAMLRAQMRLKH